MPRPAVAMLMPKAHCTTVVLLTALTHGCTCTPPPPSPPTTRCYGPSAGCEPHGAPTDPGDPMHAHEQLLRDFYAAFDRKDAETMAAAYTDDVSFSDPVFPALMGEEARDMWRMLTDGDGRLSITIRDVQADDHAGSLHWTAEYDFPATGRSVTNEIDARFTFRDGKIATHVDTFDLWAWTRMALGLPGLLLGWTPLLQAKVRSEAAKGLEKWRAKRGQ